MDYRYLLVVLVLAVGGVYSLWRLIRDIRRRRVMPPRMPVPFGSLISADTGAPFATKTFRWRDPDDRRMAIKALLFLTIVCILAAYVANYYPEFMPEPYM